eukprot:gene20157-21117_t
MFRTIILLSIAGAALADDSDLIDFCCSETTQAELTAAGAQCGPVYSDNGEPADVQAADFDQSLWSTGAINAQCFACWNEETNSLDVEQAGCADATDSNGAACNDPEGFCVTFANENPAADCWTPEIGTACAFQNEDHEAVLGFCCSETTQAELTAAGAQCGPVYSDNGEPADVQAADFDQ